MLLGIALVVVAVGGLYFRRRVLEALELFGLPRRYCRLVGLLIPWLLFGLPALVFVSVVVSIALGRDSFTVSPTGVGEWLLVYPFWIAVLVMLQTVPFLIFIDQAARVAREHLGRERISRYRAIGCLVAVAAFSLYTPACILIERSDLHVNTYQVGTAELGQSVGADDTGEPLRIAFFADLQQDHHTDQARVDEVVSLVNQHNPDLILVGGDWINTGPEYIETVARSAGNLRSRLGTFSVRGDHEHFAYRDQTRSVSEVSRALARHGVEMVHNQVRTIEHHGKRIAIMYLSYNYIFRTPVSEIRALLERAQDADYSILVTHQFDEKLAELVEDKVDLALIAHTHGGQVNPIIGVVHVPLARVETPWVAGRYQLGKTTLIVTSGIGFSIAPFRYASPASIEMIDLTL